jgi:hypothetical protein
VIWDVVSLEYVQLKIAAVAVRRLGALIAVVIWDVVSLEYVQLKIAAVAVRRLGLRAKGSKWGGGNVAVPYGYRHVFFVIF